MIENNGSVFIAGCNFHLAHVAAGKCGLTCKNVTNFEFEGHQVDLYYFFKNSTKHKDIFLSTWNWWVNNGKIWVELLKLDGYHWKTTVIRSTQISLFKMSIPQQKK